jgi:hypothetical protein
MILMNQGTLQIIFSEQILQITSSHLQGGITLQKYGDGALLQNVGDLFQK